MTASLRAELDGCTCLLMDGTCWEDDELVQLGLGQKTASQMGHLPIGGSGGSLDLLSDLTIPRVIYTHINNTNPVLLEDSPQRQMVEDNGMEVADDGLEVEIS